MGKVATFTDEFFQKVYDGRNCKPNEWNRSHKKFSQP